MDEPTADVNLDKSMKLRVLITASDDFGIDRIELIANRSGDRETIIPIVDYPTRVLKS